VVTLSALATSGYVFWQWSGDCPGVCVMNGNKSAETDFAEGWGLCGSAPQIKHSNGLGQYWFDCTALNTYNQTQATSAANAWNSSATILTETCTGTPTPYVVVATDNVSGQAAVWEYSGTYAGRVHLNSAGTTAYCPSGSDPSWG
jgi:hypothetical protein